MNFLRDPIWQFVGVILVLIGLFLTIVLYRRQTRHKEIRWNVITKIAWSSFNISNKLKSTILFEDVIVENVSVVSLMISNSGNVEILLSDYDTPIRVSFGKGAKILEAEIEKTIPSSIKSSASLSLDSESISLQPLLLNSKDSIVLKVLISQFSMKVDDITIDARIAGVKKILRLGEDEPIINTLSKATLATLLVLLIIILCGLAQNLLTIFINTYDKMFNIDIIATRFIIAIFGAIPGVLMYFFIKRMSNKRNYTFKERLILFSTPFILTLIIVVIFEMRF